MKTHIRMIIASAIVIALALTAVSGITYSWFSDTETTKISVSTATMNLVVSMDETKVWNKTEDTGTSVDFSYTYDEDGNCEMDVSSLRISNLCADAYIKIPYTVSYKSDIKTVARVTAELDTTMPTTGIDDLYDCYKNITITVGSTSKTFYDILKATVDSLSDDSTESTATVDLLSWTVNYPTNNYKDLLTDNYLIISTTPEYEYNEITFTIKLNSEIYQKNYVYTSYTHEYADDPQYARNDEGDVRYVDSDGYEVYYAGNDESGNATYVDSSGVAAVGDVNFILCYSVYDIPANRLVSFDKVVYCVETGEETTAEYTFTNVLLDFTECTGFDCFAMKWVCTEYYAGYTGDIEFQIIPFEL